MANPLMHYVHYQTEKYIRWRRCVKGTCRISKTV